MGMDTHTPLDRLLHALTHPLRRQILRSLIEGPGSATSLSKELNETLGSVSYHLNHVLYRECEIIELVKTIPRRGAIEKFYRLKPEALTEGDPVDAGDDREPARMMSLTECVVIAVAAMEAEAFVTLRGSEWEWLLTQVDSDGWSEICAASEEFKGRTRAAVESSRARAGQREKHEVMVGVAAFPAVSAPPPSS